MANTVIFNGQEFKNSTAVKAYMRKRVMEVCVTALKEEFGEELVKEVGTNEWGVVVGQISDEGCSIDAVTTLKPTVKEWADRKTAKKTNERYDLEDNALAYEMEVKEKEEERLKKEEEKALREYEKQQKKGKKKAEVKTEEDKYVVIIDSYSNGNPFVFMRDTEDTEKGTRTLESATIWKNTLEIAYPDGTIEICKASEWYENI